MNQDGSRLAWSTPEYAEKSRGTDWFWAVGLIGLTVSVVSVILNNLLFAVFVIVGTVALLLQSARKPNILSYSIEQKGIHAGNRFFPYSTLESFWVLEEINPEKVLLKSKKLFMPLITMPIGENINHEEVREFLLDFLSEEEQDEPFTERLMERLGF